MSAVRKISQSYINAGRDLLKQNEELASFWKKPLLDELGPRELRRGPAADSPKLGDEATGANDE